MMTLETHVIPVTVTDESEIEEIETTITATATYNPHRRATLQDPEEPAAYEVWNMSLALNDDLRALDTDCYGIRVEGGMTAWVDIDADTMGGESVDLEDIDLCDEIADWLMQR